MLGIKNVNGPQPSAATKQKIARILAPPRSNAELQASVAVDAANAAWVRHETARLDASRKARLQPRQGSQLYEGSQAG